MQTIGFIVHIPESQRTSGRYGRPMPRRRFASAALSLPLVLALASPALAKGPAIVDYKNCDTVHLHYKGGIAKPVTVCAPLATV
jgi:hypothetical protein